MNKKYYNRILYWSESLGYYVQISGKIHLLSDKCLEVKLPATLYALPNNDANDTNTNMHLTEVHDLSKVLQYWGKFPVGIKIKGYLDDDDKFVANNKATPNQI